MRNLIWEKKKLQPTQFYIRYRLFQLFSRQDIVFDPTNSFPFGGLKTTTLLSLSVLLADWAQLGGSYSGFCSGLPFFFFFSNF